MRKAAFAATETMFSMVTLIALATVMVHFGCSRSDSMGSTGECIVTRTWIGTTYAQRSYDLETRTIMETQSSSRRFDDASVYREYWRLDAQGHVLIHAGADPRPEQSFRTDTTYDERGNATSLVATSGVWSDLSQPPTGTTSLQCTYVNTYNPQGLLDTSQAEIANFTTSNRSKVTGTFQHDDQGRCLSSSSAWESGATVTIFQYEGGRLAQTETTSTYSSVPGANPGAPRDPWIARTRFTYDDQGRLVSREQDGGGYMGNTADGTSDIVTKWIFAADGSWTVDTLDFTNDETTDQVEINGQMRPVSHSVETWSAACASVEAQIPKATSLACRVED